LFCSFVLNSENLRWYSTSHTAPHALKSGEQAWEQAWNDTEQNGKACPSGVAFVRFNEDRWNAISSNQKSSATYYENIKDKLSKLQDVELPEFTMARKTTTQGAMTTSLQE